MKLPEWENAYRKAVKIEAACKAIGALAALSTIIGGFIYVIWYWIPQAKELLSRTN